ncbi:MAG: Wzz/FepE/Etk N-terminal domain-containing protein [Anaerolineae bacterium]
MEFGEYWRIVTKRGWILVVVALLGAIAGFGLSQVLPETYRATIQLSVEPETPSEGLNQTARDLLYNYTVNLRSHSMTQLAIDRAGLDLSTDEFLANLEVTPDTSSLILTLSTESGDPEQARLMAQALAEVFIEDRRAWNEEIDAQDRIYANIVDPIRYVPLVSPLAKVNTLAGGVLGALVGGLIVLLLEWRASDVVGTPADAQRMLGLRIVGAIPAGGQAAAPGTAARRRLLGWLDPGLLLLFAMGLTIGAGLGALVVALL